MRCYICEAEMEKTKVNKEITWKGKTITLQGLDAWVCRACKETAFEPDEVRLMQTLVGAIPEKDYPEVMNVEEVADLLRVSNQTVYNLLRKGKLPAQKIGREWRFLRSQIMALLGRTSPAAVMARAGGGTITKHDAEIIAKHLAAMEESEDED